MHLNEGDRIASVAKVAKEDVDAEMAPPPAEPTVELPPPENAE
jgi:hypothetical protein